MPPSGSDWLCSKPQGPVFLGLQAHTTKQLFLLGFQGSNPGLHALTSSQVQDFYAMRKLYHRQEVQSQGVPWLNARRLVFTLEFVPMWSRDCCSESRPHLVPQCLYLKTGREKYPYAVTLCALCVCICVHTPVSTCVLFEFLFCFFLGGGETWSH